MADISAKIRRKSLAAKKKAAIKTVKQQAKEKIRELRIQYDENPERIRAKEEEREQRKNLRIQKENARISYSSRRARPFSQGEELFNAISHGIGAGLSAAAIVLLVVRACLKSPVDTRALHVSGFSIFGATLFILYMMSTLYHSLIPYGARKVFSTLVHVSIFLLVGGTFTPFLLTKMGENGLPILIVLWSVIAVMIVLYATLKRRVEFICFLAYFILGWLLFALCQTSHTLPMTSRILFLAGGITYTAGGFFFLLRRFPLGNCIFHVLAMGGSVLHFFSVFYSI